MSRANDIAKEISRRLGLISTAAGFATDMGGHTFRGLLKIGPDKVPCTTLVEGDDRRQGDVTGAAKVDQEYTVEGYGACDPLHPNDAAHDIIADIKKAIFSKSLPKNLGGLVLKVRYNGRQILPREDGASIVAAQVVISVEYVEDLGEP